MGNLIFIVCLDGSCAFFVHTSAMTVEVFLFVFRDFFHRWPKWVTVRMCSIQVREPHVHSTCQFYYSKQKPPRLNQTPGLLYVGPFCTAAAVFMKH